MSETVAAYRLLRETLGESRFENRVYTDPDVARMAAEDKREEWVDYKVRLVKVRLLNESEGAVGNELVTVDRTTRVQALRHRALRKLTQEEREVLGLS